MSKENFWEIFKRTGDPNAYLLYKAETSKEIAPKGIEGGEKVIQKVKDDGEKRKGARA